MAKIQLILNGKDDKIEYDKLLKKYNWVIEKDQNYILSPDSDGFLCGLLITNYLGSNIVGYYDGKILVINKGVRPKSCIFIDVDINRSEVKSVGHHLVRYNKNLIVPNYNYSNCIQPNILRNFDGKKDFQRKYPFGTIHLLLGILQSAKIIKKIPRDSIWPLLFTDGVWNNLFGYTENCIEWINYLRINSFGHILYPLFCSGNQNFYSIMLGLNKFLRMRDIFNAEGYYFNNKYKVGGRNKRTGDKLKISNTSGTHINLIKGKAGFKIHEKEKDRIEGFISSMSKYVGWDYLPKKWCWKNFKIFRFTKKDFSNKKLNNGTYNDLMLKNPLSMAMTSSQNIEYTLEEPDKLN